MLSERGRARGKRATNRQKVPIHAIFSSMQYKAVQPYSKAEAEVAFVQGTSAEMTEALLGVTSYLADWQWVQTVCLALLKRSDLQVQWVAIQCLGHLATFHHRLDLGVVLPALQAHESNPKLSGALVNAFDDIALAIKSAPHLVESWEKLPQRMQRVLIEERIFERHGKRIKKRKLFRQSGGR
ncbi:MAG TPA: hypothetical protein VFV38_39855 [Ktedonobacteraceae bacterium]|nr:hypothetical protein [Ktedonobacteraceae bacterium]